MKTGRKRGVQELSLFLFGHLLEPLVPKPVHAGLAALLGGEREQVVRGVDLPAMRFEAKRRRIREALVEDGVAADIDAIVKTLLA